MSVVMKISKEGYPVESTSDENLSYSSNLASHSIFNTISMSIPVGGASVGFTHNLNYVPKVWIFMVESDAGGTYYRRIPYLDETDFKVDYFITDTTIIIETNASAASTLNFKVIIFTRSPTI